MPEELKKAFREVTRTLNEKYSKFTHKVLWGLALGWASCILVTTGVAWYLYNRIQDSREDSIVESCLDDTEQSNQNIILLQTLGVPERVVMIARKTYPINTRIECEKIAKDRI